MIAAKYLLNDLSKAWVRVPKGGQDGVAQGVVLLLVIVGIVGRLALSTASAGLIPRLIEVRIIH